MRLKPAITLVALLGCTGSLLELPAKPSGASSVRNPNVVASGATGDAGMAPSLRDGATSVPPLPAVCDGVVSIASAPMRRLSRAEYRATLSDLFPGLDPSLPELPDDTSVLGFENDARSLGSSDVLVARWEDIAFNYTEAATANRTTLARYLPCASSVSDSASQRSCGQTWIADFGLRTHRRPLTDAEVARYQSFFDQQLSDIDFDAAVQLTAMAMLQTPSFLYRLEIPSDSASGAFAELNDYEIASRLSFFLWGRMPDDALFAAAGRHELHTTDQIRAEATRMLDDDRARGAVREFHRQWLHFDRILDEEHVTRAPDLYPTWDPALRDSAKEELERFVEHTIFDGEGTLSALLTSPETELDSRLARVYGVDAPSSGWMPVTLPADQRAGLLTRVGFLAAHAHSGNGSPPLRGVYIMERLLCEARPSPPPDANVSPPQQTPGEAPRTNRELFEERTSPPECNGCHVRIDGFGYGFEHYDAIGAYRTIDNGIAVDASGELFGTGVDGQYVGAIEMSEHLAQSPRVSNCAVSRWVRYAIGRAPEPNDGCFVSALQTEFAESSGDIQDLLVDLVSRTEFRIRPVEQE